MRPFPGVFQQHDLIRFDVVVIAEDVQGRVLGQTGAATQGGGGGGGGDYCWTWFDILAELRMKKKF